MDIGCGGAGSEFDNLVMGQLVNGRQKNNCGQVVELSPVSRSLLAACGLKLLPSDVSRSLPFPTWGLFSAEISTSDSKGNPCTYIRAWFAGWLISGTVLDFLTIAWELSGTQVMEGQSRALVSDEKDGCSAGEE